MDQPKLPTEILENLDKLPDGLGVSEKHAAVILGVSVSKLQKHRVKGGGPRFVKLGAGKGGRVSYLLGELRIYLRQHMHVSTSTYLMGGADIGELFPQRPYAESGGKLYDFVATLSDEVEGIVWLSPTQVQARRGEICGACNLKLAA